MTFIKRSFLSTFNNTVESLRMEIIHETSKIGIPITIDQSFNTLTRYRGNNKLEIKKIKNKIIRWKGILLMVKNMHCKYNKNKEKNKDKKIIQLHITKCNKLIFLYKTIG